MVLSSPIPIIHTVQRTGRCTEAKMPGACCHLETPDRHSKKEKLQLVDLQLKKGIKCFPNPASVGRVRGPLHTNFRSITNFNENHHCLNKV